MIIFSIFVILPNVRGVGGECRGGRRVGEAGGE